jgi:hypothetical protein
MYITEFRSCACASQSSPLTNRYPSSEHFTVPGSALVSSHRYESIAALSAFAAGMHSASVDPDANTVILGVSNSTQLRLCVGASAHASITCIKWLACISQWRCSTEMVRCGSPP